MVIRFLLTEGRLSRAGVQVGKSARCGKEKFAVPTGIETRERGRYGNGRRLRGTPESVIDTFSELDYSSQHNQLQARPTRNRSALSPGTNAIHLAAAAGPELQGKNTSAYPSQPTTPRLTCTQNVLQFVPFRAAAAC